MSNYTTPKTLILLYLKEKKKNPIHSFLILSVLSVALMTQLNGRAEMSPQPQVNMSHQTSTKPIKKIKSKKKKG